MKFLLIFLILLAAFLFYFVLPKTEARADAVTRDLILLYDFTEADGDVIHDRTTIEPRLDLVISDPSNVEWLNPGLRVNSATVALTTAAKTKLDPALFFTNGITIEAWIKPANNTQAGPSRIVTFSKDSAVRNFTLGQDGDKYNQRFRTDQTNNNGSDQSVSTPVDTILATPTLQHVVFIRYPAEGTIFYVDKEKVGNDLIPGANNWNMSFEFGLFNEANFPTDTRTWLGDIYTVAIYRTALTTKEVSDNYLAGPTRTLPPKPTGLGIVDLAWDANTEPDLKGYKVYYGTTSRNYEWSIDVALDDEEINRNTACVSPYDPFKVVCCEYTLKGLVEGIKYYLAATAYDEDGNESAYSEELDHTAKFIQPGEGHNLQYKDVRRFEW